MAAFLTAAVRASKALTIGAAVATLNDTVTIGGVVYTWKAGPTTVAGEVKIGANLIEAASNLAAAINAGAGSGVAYGSLTVANPYVTAVSDGVSVVTVTARTPGLEGNFVAIAENGTNTVWAGGATFLSGGTGSTGTALAQVNSHLTSMLAVSQVNSDVLRDLAQLQAEITALGAS